MSSKEQEKIQQQDPPKTMVRKRKNCIEIQDLAPQSRRTIPTRSSYVKAPESKRSLGKVVLYPSSYHGRKMVDPNKRLIGRLQDDGVSIKRTDGEKFPDVLTWVHKEFQDVMSQAQSNRSKKGHVVVSAQ